jgi:anti-anti-sigma factor
MRPESKRTSAARERAAASTQTPFGVTTERDGDFCLVTVRGELDLATCEVLSAELERAQASEAKRIVLDLGSLNFIDSVGIQVLLKAQRRTANDGSRLQLFPVSGQVHDVFELTGLMREFSFVTKA